MAEPTKSRRESQAISKATKKETELPTNDVAADGLSQNGHEDGDARGLAQSLQVYCDLVFLTIGYRPKEAIVSEDSWRMRDNFNFFHASLIYKMPPKDCGAASAVLLSSLPSCVAAPCCFMVVSPGVGQGTAISVLYSKQIWLCKWSKCWLTMALMANGYAAEVVKMLGNCSYDMMVNHSKYVYNWSK